MPEAEQTPSSHGRWYILGLICPMYLITYLDRVNISTAARRSARSSVRQDHHGHHFQRLLCGPMALFQVPGGWLSDRFGARPVLATIVAYWSVMTAATAAATGAFSFVVLRFLFGSAKPARFRAPPRDGSSGNPRSDAVCARAHPQRKPARTAIARRSVS